MSEPFLYEVGDEFEGSPIQQNKFITEVLAVGGLVGIDGNIVRILYLPGKGSIFDKEEEEAKAQAAKKSEPKAETIADTQASIDQIEKFNKEVEDPASDGTDAVAVAVNVSGEYEEVLHTSEAGQGSNEPVEAFENEGGAVAPKPATKRGRPRKVTTEEA